MPIVNYLHTIVLSKYWNTNQWQSWADRLIVCNDNLEEWVYDVAIAKSREELLLAIAHEKTIEIFNKETLYWEPDVVIGYYYLMFQESRIKLSELFEKLFDEDDASSESEFFDSQEAKRILNQARKDEYNLEKIDKILEPFAKIAKKHLEALQHYERDKNVER